MRDCGSLPARALVETADWSSRSTLGHCRACCRSGRVVRVRRDAYPVEVYAGHVESTRVVHLTARSFLVESLCGEAVGLDGDPDVAVICEECHELAVAYGGDPESWVVAVEVFELRAAA